MGKKNSGDVRAFVGLEILDSFFLIHRYDHWWSCLHRFSSLVEGASSHLLIALFFSFC